MDPIRTAVKYSLIPLRTIVQLGELYVEAGQEPPSPPQPQRREPQKRSQPRRTTASPQASQKPKDLDDVSLARKVETVIFRDDAVAKGKIDVNAADGVVWLRGEAKTPDQIKTLEQQASAIPEVRKVENLLHLPKTPAPASKPRKRQADRKVETAVTGNSSVT